ncbi:thermonuclease family protein [Agromyces sp. PvR057]|uniref:thermonuclease family protein n=1 Tax=Agromyces sp. PvR057 TaxID=3156403 RepID=UPI003392E4FE
MLAVASLAAGAVAVGTQRADAAEQGTIEHATVERVIDGDTVDVRTGDLVTRIRLLNIDTPELAHGGKPAECLAVEATNALNTLLPAGSDVTLDYDVAKVDRYGRTLAAVTNASGQFVEEQLALQGLGARAYFGDNKRFLPAVTEAQQIAESTEAGMWNPALDCTPAALVKSLEQQATKAATPLPKDTVGLAETIVAASVILEAADVAEDGLDAMSWLRSTSYRQFADPIDAVRSKAMKRIDRSVDEISPAAKADRKAERQAVKKTAASTKPTAKEKAAAKKKAKATKKARLLAGENAASARTAATKAAADREAARVAEAARIAAEQEAARVAAEQEAARVAADEAAQRAAAEQAQQQASSSDSDSDSDSGSSSGGGGSNDGGGSTYTGCRNYNGTGMIDSKGRSFAPIPC